MRQMVVTLNNCRSELLTEFKKVNSILSTGENRTRSRLSITYAENLKFQ